MLIRRTLAIACVLGLASAGAMAPLHAAEAGLEIEFNKIEQTDAGCRLTFKTTNRLPVKLESFSIELYLLDPKGVALESVQFTFGAIAMSKARFSKFDLKDRPCADVGGIFINEFKSCKSDTGKPDTDMVRQCSDTLLLKNLTAITFSDGAS